MPRKENMETAKGKDSSVGLSYPMLTKSNYTAWAFKMRVFMQAHGIWLAVESTDDQATIEKKTDKVALAAIYQSIPEDVLLSVAEKKTAKDAWDAIKTMCLGAEKVKKAKIQTLKSEFENLRMKETDAMDDFCMRLNVLVANIRALGETIEEAYVVKKLLCAVPSRFLQIASTIEQFGDLDAMTVEETVGSLKAHEERIRGQSESQDGQLFLTEEDWLRRDRGQGQQLLLSKEEWMKKLNNGGVDVLPQKTRGSNSY